MILTFDTETSGLVVKDKPLSDPSQPRVVQLGFTLHDMHRRELQTYRTLLKPAGWEITKEAAQVHGFSTDDCARFGVEPRVALLAFVSAIKCSKYIVAHGLGFDAGLITRELRLLDEELMRSTGKGIAEAQEGMGLTRPRLVRICTMKTGTAFTPDGKWPSLSRLYRIIVGEEFEEAHDALEDARATAKVFWGLVDRRAIEL